MRIVNPATEETITEVPEDGARQVAAKFAAAAAAQPRWARLSLDERRHVSARVTLSVEGIRTFLRQKAFHWKG